MILVLFILRYILLPLNHEFNEVSQGLQYNLDHLSHHLHKTCWNHWQAGHTKNVLYLLMYK